MMCGLMGRKKHDSIERFIAWRGKRSGSESDDDVRHVADELFKISDGGPVAPEHVDSLVARRRKRLSGARSVMAARSIGDDLARWDAHGGEPPPSSEDAASPKKSKGAVARKSSLFRGQPRAERSTLRSEKDSAPPSKSVPPNIELELELDVPARGPAKVGSVPPIEEDDELFQIEHRPPLSGKAPASSYPPTSSRPPISSAPPASSEPGRRQMASGPAGVGRSPSSGRPPSSRPPMSSDPRTSLPAMSRSEPMSRAPASLPPSQPPAQSVGDNRGTIIKIVSAVIGVALVALVVTRPSCLFSQPAEQVGPGSWTSSHLGLSLDVTGSWTHEPDADGEEPAEPFVVRDAKLFVGGSEAEFRSHLRIAAVSKEGVASMDDVHRAEKLVKLTHNRRCTRTEDETVCFSVHPATWAGAKKTYDAFEYYFLVEGRVVYLCARFVYQGDAGDMHGEAPEVDAADPDTLIKRRQADAIVASIR